MHEGLVVPVQRRASGGGGRRPSVVPCGNVALPHWACVGAPSSIICI